VHCLSRTAYDLPGYSCDTNVAVRLAIESSVYIEAVLHVAFSALDGIPNISTKQGIVQ
jgi:hypothetical protein